MDAVGVRNRNYRMGKIVGVVGIVALLATACEGLFGQSTAPASGPVIVNNTPGDGGSMVLLAVTIVGGGFLLLILAAACGYLFMGRKAERDRRKLAEWARERDALTAYGPVTLNGAYHRPAIGSAQAPAYTNVPMLEQGRGRQ